MGGLHVRQPVRCQIAGGKKRCALLMHCNSDNECTFLLPSARAPTSLFSLWETKRMLSVTSAGSNANGCWFKILKFANGPRSTRVHLMRCK